MEHGRGLLRIRGIVKEFAKILAYLGAVLVGGALLAPALYGAAHALMAAGWLLVLKKYAFQKYFNRAVLVVAVALFWPLVRWLGVRGWTPPAFRPDPLWRRRLWLGAGMGAGAMLVLAWGYLASGVYVWDALPSTGVCFKVLFSAVTVAVLEESLFRGGISGLLERARGRTVALWCTSGLFAMVHFLKPDPAVQVETVRWLSGFELVPHMFHQFAQPLLFLGGFGTLLVLGLVLGLAVQRTGSLWVSIGFHGGLVLVKLLFSKAAERKLEMLPWVGPELQIGLAPVAVLLFAGVVLWVMTKPEPSAKIV